jgi:hypothetical protein
MEINVNGSTKRLVATNCVIKSSLFSRLGFGKKREVLACQSLDIMDDDHQEQTVDEAFEDEADEEDVEEMVARPGERAKATPKQPKGE